MKGRRASAVVDETHLEGNATSLWWTVPYTDRCTAKGLARAARYPYGGPYPTQIGVQPRDYEGNYAVSKNRRCEPIRLSPVKRLSHPTPGRRGDTAPTHKALVTPLC